MLDMDDERFTCPVPTSSVDPTGTRLGGLVPEVIHERHLVERLRNDVDILPNGDRQSTYVSVFPCRTSLFS